MTHHLIRALCASTLVVAAACGGAAPEPTPAPASDPAPAPAAQSAAPAAAPAQTTPEPAKDEDGHSHTAPHGGALLELGDHFAFLELVVEPDTGKMTLYVLDGEAEKAVRLTHKAISVRVEAPTGVGTLDLQGRANTLTGETVGDTSEFVATHAGLKGATKVQARVGEIVVKGQTLRDLSITWPGDHD